MAATPEIPRSEAPSIQERQEEFPETIQQIVGAKVIQKNFKAQVSDDKGQPVIQTPPTQVISVTPPSDSATLTNQAKGNTTTSLTWLAAFWLRIIKKAMHFGWKITGKGPNVS
jgi:hypothetical protein